MEPWQAAAQYHQETKHDFGRYARSAGFMDWANQPDPFRRFHGAPLIRLPLLSNDAEAPSYDDLYLPRAICPQPVRFETLAEFLQYALALSAWKEFRGSRWALRINPSSGNLHPTEGYLVLGPTKNLHDAAAVYHYAPKEHGLERRTDIVADTWAALLEGFPPQTFFVGLSSVHWREAWKYGERAYRYCQHDAGHALAALVLSAAMLGWQATLLDAMGDAEIAALLGLDRSTDDPDIEREHPDLMLAVTPTASPIHALPRRLPQSAVANVAQGEWNGEPSRLSAEHMPWEIIDATADACVKLPRVTEVPSNAWPVVGEPLAPGRDVASARRIIFQRRSAVAMDGETSMPADAFYLMMDRVLPREGVPPFGTFGLPVCVHLALFVHLVEGLSSGLYLLLRSPDRFDDLRASTRPDFAWKKPAGCPASLPLYLLMEGDARRIAQQVSCGQWIASQGAFSLGMMAECAAPLRTPPSCTG